MASEKDVQYVHTGERDSSADGDHIAAVDPSLALFGDYEGRPSDEEFKTLRRVPGNIPLVAYLLCAVEFAERSSYYGVQQLIGNFVKQPLPKGGNGYGAPPPGTQETGGALGLGSVKSNAIRESFNMLVYLLPLVFGYLADTRTGRFRMICYGIIVVGLSHILMVGATAPSILANGDAKIPYLISLYMLCISSAMFKPCISPLLLDQMKNTKPVVKTITKRNGETERVIEDPESTTERVMLWFYLLINIGGFMGVATSYSEKYVGWWLAFLIPLLFWIPIVPLLFFLRKRLVLHPPGKSDLGNVFRVVRTSIRRGGLKKLGTQGFWDLAKPSHMAAAGLAVETRWNDQFVEDVKRSFQATAIFSFFPIQFINDNGLGSSAGIQSVALVTDGVPNDVLSNFNTLSIIICAPLVNYVLYPFLRRSRIHYGPIARITTAFLISAIGGVGYAVLQQKIYELSPCGWQATNECEIGTGVAPITIWWQGLPYALGGISEIFCNVPAYGLAYSRSPVNLRGFVSAINLANTGVAYACGLIFSALITDPNLVRVFAVPAGIGFVSAGLFYFVFRKIDKEEYTVTRPEDYQLDSTGTHNVQRENSINFSSNRPSSIVANEEMGISVKQ